MISLPLSLSRTVAGKKGQQDILESDVGQEPKDQKVPDGLSTWQARQRTLFALLCLWGFAPLLCLWAFSSWCRRLVFGVPFDKGEPPKRCLNVLVTGGKMSKASAVARAVGRSGHKVFTAEILPYRYCHTRYCTYVSKHYVLPRPVDEPEAWQKAIKAIVAEQNIDLIIPCTAPIESSAYAHLRDVLPEHVRVFAFDGKDSDELDNKYTFNQALVRGGVPCPETGNMESFEDAVEFFKQKKAEGCKKQFIVKPAVYDPSARTEILFLPIEDTEKQTAYLRSRNASHKTPYVIQEVLSEPEFGCYSTFTNGTLTGFELFQSCASCLVYQQLPDKKQFDAVLNLNQKLGKTMGLTGQLTLDVMHTADGELVPIECNPRIHSAVCLFEGHRNLGALFTDPDYAPATKDVVSSNPQTRKFWFMDQMMLQFGFWKPKNCIKLNTTEMMGGTDALLHGDDPMPFLAMYLIQIPSLLVQELIAGTPWLKIDFCIGKIVKEGGD